jgi:hypothetical protein
MFIFWTEIKSLKINMLEGVVRALCDGRREMGHNPEPGFLLISLTAVRIIADCSFLTIGGVTTTNLSPP